MPETTKKEIRQIAEDALHLSLEKLKIAAPSKKTKKRLSKISKGLAQILREELKRGKKLAKSVLAKTKKQKSKPPIATNKKTRKSKRPS